MKNGGNENHPQKGSTIKVEPIKNRKDISTLKKLLLDRPRDLALFIIGINTNLISIYTSLIKRNRNYML